MDNWEPGQKLVHEETDEQAVWFGDVASCAFNAVWRFSPSSINWVDAWINPSSWRPVDAWSDPVADARDRVMAYLGDRHNRFEGTTVDALVTMFADDLRLLLDAEEGKCR